MVLVNAIFKSFELSNSCFDLNYLPSKKSYGIEFLKSYTYTNKNNEMVKF